ncbi:MAG: YebC/PmpR family DNA-binding transcriptional regulator, partial [Gammaproteobacteria bacterium]
HGDSLLVVSDDEIVKVHIHTESPGTCLNLGQRFGSFLKVKESMEKVGLMPESAEITLRASTSVPLDAAHAESVMKLLEALESLEDVQTVYSNADFPDEVLQAMTG